MKKVYLLSIIALFTLTKCGIGDISYVSKYVYQNNTEWNLVIEANSPFGSNKTMIQEIFELKPGESHTISLSLLGGFRDPLNLGSDGKYGSYTIVHNGESKVINYGSDDDELYNLENYTLISSEKVTRTYEYIFEESFFDNAEPLSQE